MAKLSDRAWTVAISRAFAVLTTSVAMSAAASAQVTRVSVGPGDTEANGASRLVSVSADGRYVAFVSAATNLVANDTNGVDDVFVKDRQSGTVTRVSVGAGGAEAAAASGQPSISDDGRLVSFTSLAALSPADPNVCAGDANACEDVYVHDLVAHTTTLASAAPAGGAAMRGRGAKISGNGRYVVFSSPSANLAAEPAGVRIFIRDLVDQKTEPLSVAGALIPSEGLVGAVSADGQIIGFGAHMNLLPPPLYPILCDDPAGCMNAFLVTRQDGQAMRLYSTGGDQSTRSSYAAPIGMSADGERVLVAQTADRVFFGDPTSVMLFERSSNSGIYSLRGVPGNAVTGVVAAAISRDGSTIAYCDTQSGRKILARDERTKLLETVRDFGNTPGHCATGFDLSRDGRWLFAVSELTDLVPNDQNGTFDIFAFDRDRDGDGMLSVWEERFNFDPANASDAAADPDGDGLTNLQEFQRMSHPRGLYTRYFAEGSANAFFKTEIGLFNTSGAEALTLVTHVSEGGRARHRWEGLLAGAETVLVPTYPLFIADSTFSTIIESDQPFVAERSQHWSNVIMRGVLRGYGSHGETSTEAPRREWHFAEGATGVYNLYYQLLNPNDAPAHVTVKYLRPAPLTPVTITYDIGPNSRYSIDVNAQPGVGITEVGAMITSDLPILAERSQYLSRPGEFWSAGHAGAAIAEPALEWFVAEGATGFFRTYLVIANPGDGDAQLTVSYLLPDGTKVDKPHVATKSSRLTIDVASEDPAFAAATMAMTVRSTNNVPVIVERVMWWPADAPYEAAVSSGATSPGRDWAAAMVPMSSSDGENVSSYLLIANPSDQSGNVTIQMGHAQGVMACVTTRPILPHSRMTIDARTICETGTGTTGRTVTIRSDGPPIVAERATYRDVVRWDNGKATLEQFWGAGEAVPLTKIAPLPQ